jgi:hypothetical protein
MEGGLMLSEKEASDKWCPFVRGHETSMSSSVNRRHSGKPSTYAMCLGSACMAWRWEDRLRDRGYCGMAGKPVVP